MSAVEAQTKSELARVSDRAPRAAPAVCVPSQGSLDRERYKPLHAIIR